MDVLNTYGGGIDSGVVILVIIFGLLALFFLVGAVVTKEVLFIALTVALIFSTALTASNLRAPITHEVTLRPGGVIDAVKYDIIEQRGAIYVIEEREAAQ